MTNLPAPLAPPDCDLRGYDYMPLFGHRLFTSSFNDKANDTEFRVAIRLWWSAWQQCPAGSLPNDEVALARLADFGRDLKGWRKVGETVLRGFVLCSDGRLYHPMLSEAAVRAYEMKLKADSRREADRRRLQAWREARRKREADKSGNGSGGGEDGGDETPPETRFNNGPETRFDTQKVAVGIERKGKEGKEKEEEPPYAPLAEPDAPAEPSPTRGKYDRGMRLSDDWSPDEGSVALAAALSLDLPEAVTEFRDYWCAVPGSRGRKLDWDATFRNRCRERAARLRLRPRDRPGETASERRIREQREALHRIVHGEDEPVTIDAVTDFLTIGNA